MLTVLYDDLCPLCKKEITFYQSKMNAIEVKWIGLSDVDNPSLEFGVSREMALRQLHVRQDDMDWMVGVDAFIHLWRHMPKLRLLSLLVSFPMVYQLSKLAYGIFARWRYSRLAHCRRCND